MSGFFTWNLGLALLAPVATILMIWWSFVFTPLLCREWAYLRRSPFGQRLLTFEAGDAVRWASAGLRWAIMLFALLQGLFIFFLKDGVSHNPDGGGNPETGDVGTYLAVMAIILTLGAAFAAMYLDKVDSRVEKAHDAVRKVEDAMLGARAGLAGVVAAELIPTATRTSFPSHLGDILEALEPICRQVRSFDHHSNHIGVADRSRLQIVEAMNQILRHSAINVELVENCDYAERTTLARRFNQLELITYRQTAITNKLYNKVSCGDGDLTSSERLLCAQFYLVAAKQADACVTNDLDEAGEILKDVKRQLEDLPSSGLPAVTAYYIKTDMIDKCLSAPRDYQATDWAEWLNEHKDAQSRACAFLELLVASLIQEVDPAIVCNYMMVGSLLIEAIVFSSLCEGDLKAPSDTVKNYPQKPQNEPEDKEDWRFSRLLWLTVADAWCKHARKNLRQITDRDFRVLSELTDQFCTDSEIEKDLTEIQALLEAIQNYVLSEEVTITKKTKGATKARNDTIEKNAERRKKLFECHRRVWLPPRDRWLASCRNLRGV